LRTAKAIEQIAAGNEAEKIALLEIAMAQQGQVDYEVPALFAVVSRPTVAKMEIAAAVNKWPRLHGYCVSQAIFGASVAQELGLKWQLVSSVKETHAWLAVYHQNQWFDLNAKDSTPESKHNPPAKTHLIKDNWFDPRLNAVGYDGRVRILSPGDYAMLWSFFGPCVVGVILALLIIFIHSHPIGMVKV
jgi:hypothetical protein